MVQLLTQADKENALKLLYQNAVLNCYIIGDIENSGFDNPIITFYGEYDEEKLESILMIYDRYGFFYQNKDTLNPEYIDIINRHKVDYVSGDNELINMIYQYYPNKKKRESKLASLLKSDIISNDPEICIISSDEEFEELYHLLVKFEEFNVKDSSLSEFIAEKKGLDEFGQTYAIYRDEIMIATASVISETSDFGVINGVATHQDYRKQGLANRLIDQIISDYINGKKKGLILYYDNPEASRIYFQKGFKEVGTWSSITMSM